MSGDDQGGLGFGKPDLDWAPPGFTGLAVGDDDFSSSTHPAAIEVAVPPSADLGAFGIPIEQLAAHGPGRPLGLNELPHASLTPQARDDPLFPNEHGPVPSLDAFYAPEDDDATGAGVTPPQPQAGSVAAPDTLRDFLLDELADELSGYNGLESLKRMFWELLAYERVDHHLGQGAFPSSVAASVLSARLFARHEGVNVIVVQAHEGRFLRTVRCAVLEAAAARWENAVLLFCDYGWRRVAVGSSGGGGQFIRLAPVAADVNEQARRLGLVRAYSAEGEPRSTFDLVGSYFRLFERRPEDVWEPVDPAERAIDPFQVHLRCLDRYPTMPRSETQDLLRRIAGISAEERLSGRRDEYERCRDRLVMGHLRLCEYVINEFALEDRRHSLERTDLTQEGVFGLIAAIARFDVAQGTEFSTYAVYWVRQAIQKAIYDKDCFIRIPPPQGKKLDRSRVNERRRRLGRVLSLSRGEDGVWHEMEDQRHGRPADPLEAREAAEKRRVSVEAALRSLPTRTRQMMSLRFGLAKERESTLQELGDCYGLTRERVRQIEEKALGKLREGPHAKRLIEALS
jgi:RNA polymerase primary sigma factor